VFENRLLRTCGPKEEEEEATRRWRILHNEELYNMSSSHYKEG
jgi:hypothetical protein